jgi:hypothetical protein
MHLTRIRVVVAVALGSAIFAQGRVDSTVSTPVLQSAGAVFRPEVRTKREGDACLRARFLAGAGGRTQDQHAEWESTGRASLRWFLLRCKGGSPTRRAELGDRSSADSESAEHSASNCGMRRAHDASPFPQVHASDVDGTERNDAMHDRARKVTMQWHEAARKSQEHGSRMRERALAQGREEFLDNKRRGSGPEDGAGLGFGSVHDVSTLYRQAFCWSMSMRDFWTAEKVHSTMIPWYLVSKAKCADN